jgi:tRNA(Ile)-lysidine synthase
MLIEALNKFSPEPKSLLIAYSGGVDSHVLLHAFAHCGIKHQLRAVHIHHGLSPNANNWVKHAEEICSQLHIPLTVHKLHLNIQKGESIEAIARDARYQYFAEILRPDEILCTAHHEDDQMETVLLQLLRGAGPKGLAAMSAIAPFAQGFHARPLLSVAHDLILNYAKEKHLKWIIDESNDNIQFDRNFLRHDIIPLIKKRFPAAAQTVARSASHCATAQQVIEKYISEEIKKLAGDFADTLSRKKLSALDDDLQSQILRTWLHEKNIPMPSTDQLQAMQKLLTLDNDVKAIVCLQKHSARLYRDNLFVEENENFTPEKPNVDIRFHENGDGLHVKKLFQENNIPPWQRESTPLIYINDVLIGLIKIPL